MMRKEKTIPGKSFGSIRKKKQRKPEPPLEGIPLKGNVGICGKRKCDHKGTLIGGKAVGKKDPKSTRKKGAPPRSRSTLGRRNRIRGGGACNREKIGRGDSEGRVGEPLQGDLEGGKVYLLKKSSVLPLKKKAPTRPT